MLLRVAVTRRCFQRARPMQGLMLTPTSFWASSTVGLDLKGKEGGGKEANLPWFEGRTCVESWMVLPKGLGLVGERYLEVLGPGHLERIPAGQALSSAAERITVSSHFISSPLYTHSGLVLVLRFLPLNFWFLSPSSA